MVRNGSSNYYFWILQKNQILTKTGVIITNVKEDSIAYENELQQGDVIKEIDNEPIKSISDFKKAVKKQNLKMEHYY